MNVIVHLLFLLAMLQQAYCGTFYHKHVGTLATIIHGQLLQALNLNDPLSKYVISFFFKMKYCCNVLLKSSAKICSFICSEINVLVHSFKSHSLHMIGQELEMEPRNSW